MDILILITTYNRPDELLLLLQDIEKFSYNYTVHLLVYNDCSSKSYNRVINYLKKYFAFDYFVTEENGGKNKYYQLINCAYKEVEKHKFDYFIQLPDDVRLTDDFFSNAILTYDNIRDRKKACLNILNDYSRFGKPVWTAIESKKVEFNKLQYHQSGWVDMCFICKRRFFQLINFTVGRVEPIYLSTRRLSSGVGSTISKKIVNGGATIYQVVKSLVIHNDHASVMHPEHRIENPLISNHETVIAGMATMESRIPILKKTIASIIDQVDVLEIYLNNFYQIPDFLKHPKIKIYQSQKELGDLGDAGKFYNAANIKGYHFTIDDDIIYPPDYVKTLIHAIERNKKEYIITVHGRKFNHAPVKSYYHSAEVQVSCLRACSNDTIVDIPGTGVMAYHTDTINLSINDFKASNMGDIWVGKVAKEKNVKILAIKHNAGWLKDGNNVKVVESIYHQLAGNDSFQTEVVNSFLGH